MWLFNLKKMFREFDKKVENGFKKRDKEIASLKVQLDNLDLDKKIDKLVNRIDNILIEALKNKAIIPSPIKSKSKESLSQVQEDRLIQTFRHTKKQIAKDMILKLQETTPTPILKTRLMKELGISKASFYNYLKELDNEIKVQVVQKSKKS